ncbi:hypothetical protein M422DRAFT_272220 [Sphaerobolus stellatus SS14]|uniref:Unplaced genomic scaffold SPHSTscaffold_285, whole genome shotgun sequence n=1 Tax=Sphaerobolus stellatus (strain SS14) TaxID=990650 RepID=A0A0C9TC20_SPHS4|nr:hypothetical protein M422DRAFT_272220 [Sphaerobolus stellatus SS14]
MGTSVGSFSAKELRAESMAVQVERSIAHHFILDIQSQFGRGQGGMWNWQQDPQLSETRHIALMSLTGSLCTRTTSRISDETLCIASMLAMDNTPPVSITIPGVKSQDNELRKLADRELADRRMELMCHLIGKFSEDVIFLKYLRFPTLRYRCEFYPPSHKKYDDNIVVVHTSSDGRSDVGLIVSLPVILLGPLFSEFNAYDGSLIAEAAIEDPSKEEFMKSNRYLIQPLQLNETGEHFSWVLGTSYCLIMQCPRECRVNPKPTVAVIGRLFPEDTDLPRIRHESLARVRLLDSGHCRV